MFDGFLLYELILLILGIVLFLVLLFIAVYLMLKGRPVNNILKFFVIPIIMIAWPGIQKVKFLNGLAEIEMLTDRAHQNPEDAEARAALSESLEEIEGRRVTNPATMVKIAHAEVAVGDTLTAYGLLRDAVKKQPDYDLAVERLKAIDTPEIRSRSKKTVPRTKRLDPGSQ